MYYRSRISSCVAQSDVDVGDLFLRVRAKGIIRQLLRKLICKREMYAIDDNSASLQAHRTFHTFRHMCIWKISARRDILTLATAPISRCMEIAQTWSQMRRPSVSCRPFRLSIFKPTLAVDELCGTVGVRTAIFAVRQHTSPAS